MIKPEVLEWLRQAQKLLKEKFDLDTTKRADMGRIKLNQPWRVGYSGAANLIDFGETVDETCQVNNMYACISRDETGCKYWEEPPDGGQERVDWLINHQGTFDVKEVDGKLTIETTMSDAALNALYDNAKDGRIYVNAPGTDIATRDPRCQFLCVSQNGMPMLYDDGMSEEEMKDLENPNIVRDHVEQFRQAMDNQATVAETRDLLYETNFWHNAHLGLPILSKENHTLVQHTITGILSDQVQVDPTFLDGDGLENFFVEQSDGSMSPLFPDRTSLQEKAQGENLDDMRRAQSEISQRLLRTLKEKPIYIYGPNNRNAEKTCAAEIRLRRNGQLRTHVVAETDPVKPSWYKRLLNSINKNWYKGEMEQYRTKKAAHDEALRQKENAAVARGELLNEGAAQTVDSPQRERLRQKNAQAVKSRKFETMVDRFKKDSLSQLSQQVSEEESIKNAGDIFAQMMFVNDLENVAKNGTEDAKEFLYKLSGEDIADIYRNVYIKAPDVVGAVKSIIRRPDSEYTVNDYLGSGMSDVLLQVGDDPAQYEPEDLQLVNTVSTHLDGFRKNFAVSQKIKPFDMEKVIDLLSKAKKAEKKVEEKPLQKQDKKQTNAVGRGIHH